MVINTVSPGFTYTNLTREAAGIMQIILSGSQFLLARTTEIGSRTLVHAAAAGQNLHGVYLSECVLTSIDDMARGKAGLRLCRRIWNELGEVFEGLEPGITSAL